MSHFFAYISKLRWVIRWGLKRNAISENVMEHSWDVATIAHALAVIGNKRYNACYDVNAIAVAALYHDVTEVITGDMPTPIKYHSPGMQNAFKAVELQAEQELCNLLPDDIRPEFERVIISENLSYDEKKLIKCADTIAALLKCKEEIKAGNTEFSKAYDDVEERLKSFNMPEVNTFLELFAPSYYLTLDELMNGNEKVRNLKID